MEMGFGDQPNPIFFLSPPEAGATVSGYSTLTAMIPSTA